MLGIWDDEPYFTQGWDRSAPNLRKRKKSMGGNSDNFCIFLNVCQVQKVAGYIGLTEAILFFFCFCFRFYSISNMTYGEDQIFGGIYLAGKVKGELQVS